MQFYSARRTEKRARARGERAERETFGSTVGIKYAGLRFV